MIWPLLLPFEWTQVYLCYACNAYNARQSYQMGAVWVEIVIQTRKRIDKREPTHMKTTFQLLLPHRQTYRRINNICEPRNVHADLIPEENARVKIEVHAYVEKVQKARSTSTAHGRDQCIRLLTLFYSLCIRLARNSTCHTRHYCRPLISFWILFANHSSEIYRLGSGVFSVIGVRFSVNTQRVQVKPINRLRHRRAAMECEKNDGDLIENGLVAHFRLACASNP